MDGTHLFSHEELTSTPEMCPNVILIVLPRFDRRTLTLLSGLVCVD